MKNVVYGPHPDSPLGQLKQEKNQERGRWSGLFAMCYFLIGVPLCFLAMAGTVPGWVCLVPLVVLTSAQFIIVPRMLERKYATLTPERLQNYKSNSLTDRRST